MRYENGVRFNDSELEFVRQALQVAADVYKGDGATMRKNGLDRIAAQLDRPPKPTGWRGSSRSTHEI